MDSTVPHAARIYDYLLGGSNNFEADRAAIHALAEASGGLEALRQDARTNRAFIGRAVRQLVGEGVRQFLDIGSGLPTQGNVHEVAQEADASCRVVYVDRDPLVLDQAKPLLRSTSEGSTSFIHGDLLEPGSIVLRAEATLDFAEPIGVLMVALLHWVPDDQDPFGAVRQLVDALPSGSYLVLSHLGSDIDDQPEQGSLTDSDANSLTALNVTARSRDQVLRFLDGLELVELEAVSGQVASGYFAIGRKP
jgi:hypothetical protein